MKIVIKTPKPRNPYVGIALQRKAGPHTKTNKARRRLDKVKLRGDYCKFLRVEKEICNNHLAVNTTGIGTCPISLDRRWLLG